MKKTHSTKTRMHTTTAPFLLPNTPIPQFTINITQVIINGATPENSGNCVIAVALRVDPMYASSVKVDKEFMTFNKMGMDRDGTEKMMRYIYRTPAHVALKLYKFDKDAAEHGIEYARSQMKPFKFRLHSDGMANPVKRNPNHKRGPDTVKRRVKLSEVRRCANRYMGLRVIEKRAAVG